MPDDCRDGVRTRDGGCRRMPRLAALAAALACCCVAPAARAQDFDYDPGRSAALRPCDEHRYRGRIAEARACYDELTRSATDTLVQAEAAWGMGDLRRANELFREASRRAERSARVRTRWGRLFLATHQYADAQALFREALERDAADLQARLGLARLFADRFEGNARSQVEEIVKQDDTLIEAHLLAARMDLEEGRLAAAERSAKRALSLAERQRQPPLEAYELLAALDLMRGEHRESRWTKRALQYNPRYGGVFETLAHYEIMRRRYREASAWLARAIEVQPDRWSAQSEYGVNLLRLGDVKGARQALERAYSGDPFSAITVNSLRVLDKLEKFSVARASGPDIVTWLDPKEADALRPYVDNLARESIATFSRRYGFEPREPITIELYPNHDDFAVRTAGLPGIGLLGVTFGYLVAMDSPSGRAAGDFHWGSTLWHELAHVFTLSVTDHRVPRWLSEGISVFEEWRTGPTPGIAVSPRALDVFREGKFLPVARLDEGFIRPDYGDQIQVSYMQSGLICLFIEQRWGFERLVALLREFTRDTTTAAAIEATFKMSPTQFDEAFAAFMRERFARILEQPKEWERAMLAAHEAAQAGQWEKVIEPARRASEIFPDYTLQGSTWLLLAQAQDRLGRRDEAIQTLKRYRELGGWDPGALRRLAELLEQAGDTAQSTEVLNALLLIEPLDATLHARLGERYQADGKPAEALREYRVLLALNAHDTASANLGLARAYHSLGDRANSRRHLLDALETAPHFRPAQDLLLEITGKPTQ